MIREAQQVYSELAQFGNPTAFFQTGYQTKSWSCQRKVIARVEATSKGADARRAQQVADHLGSG
jgi:hypothetical protein